jgi:uncharacterized Ntn-hydrolase superfamily protein
VTYSIVARDRETGHLGVAAQSCYFALGTVLPWARAGVGAVATQAMVNPAYGPLCLDLMEGGASATSALEHVRANDPDHALRQVGVVSAGGEVASFTGSQCFDHVGHAQGSGYTTQANMMAGDGVCEAMAAAFESTPGSLAQRMLASLVAAEGEGGDARGQMSAALLVVEGTRQALPWQGVLTELRVDHHHDPLGELAHLVLVAEAYHLCDLAEEALVAGDAAGALASAEAGLQLLPDDVNLPLSYIAGLAGVGRIDEARTYVQGLISRKPALEDLFKSMAARGFLPLPTGMTMDSLLENGDAGA